MQISKHHRRSMSLALRGSDTDPFTSSFSELEKEKKCTFFVLLYLQDSFYSTFVIYLLPGLVCQRGENSKLILHLKYFYFCLFFDVNFSFQASVKNFHMNFDQSFSVCLGSSGGSSVAGRPPVIHIRDEKTVCVCPSWTCVRRGQTLGVSRTRLCSRTSSII